MSYELNQSEINCLINLLAFHMERQKTWSGLSNYEYTMFEATINALGALNEKVALQEEREKNLMSELLDLDDELLLNSVFARTS